MSSNKISSFTSLFIKHGSCYVFEDKNSSKGGSNVRTTVLRELNRKCKCGHGLGTQPLTGFRGQEAT